MAPGSQIASTLPLGGYGAWSGTSMATPMVAGIAALARTYWPDKAIIHPGSSWDRLLPPLPGWVVTVQLTPWPP